MQFGLRDAVWRWIDPLGHRLMLLFAVLALPPTLVSIVASVGAYGEMLARVRENTEHFAVLASSYERTLIDQSENLLDKVAAETAVWPRAPDHAQAEQCSRTLRSAIEPYPIYAALILFAPDGTVLCSNNASYANVNVADRDWFQEVLRSGTMFLSDRVFVRGPDVPAIVLARPVPGPHGDVGSVLAISIDLAELQPFERFRGLPRGGAIYLLDRNGTVLTGLEHPTETGNGGMPALPITQIIDGQTLVTIDAEGRDGLERIYAVAPMRRGALFILVGLPRSQIIGWFDKDLPIQLLGIAAMWAAGLLAAWLGTRVVVTRWTRRLTDTAKAMSQGDLAARTDLTGAPVEIRRFGETLGEMATRLETRRRELQEALEEKDTLLREIHHRVKNNLQTVISLLNLQTKGIRHDTARIALQQLKMRIQTLGLVHRHLYESEGLKTVDLRTFLGELCRLLQDGSGVSFWQVRCALDIAPVNFQIERAVPLALLVTELVTNSFKHAFPDGRTGTIQVRLVLEDDIAKLSVADDGIGTSAGDAGDGAGQRSGLGLTLTEALARQLNGSLTVSGPPGTTTTLTFPLDPSKEAPPGELFDVAAADNAGVESVAAPPTGSG
jgi:two-component sensor histidine kinase